MIDKEALLDALALHALTGLPIMIPDGVEQETCNGGKIFIWSEDGLIDPSRKTSWLVPSDAPGVSLTHIERSRATILLTRMGRNLRQIEVRAQEFRNHSEMASWIAQHSGEKIKDASLRGDVDALKTLISQGAYPHAYDYHVIYHAVKRADAAFADWLLSQFPASGEILSRCIFHGFLWAVDYIHNVGSSVSDESGKYENRVRSLIEVLGRHQQLPKLSAQLARNLVETRSPETIGFLLEQGVLAKLEPNEAILVEYAFLNAASVRTSDRYLEVLIDAGLDISCFPRAKSIKDCRDLEADLTSSGPTARPSINRLSGA